MHPLRPLRLSLIGYVGWTIAARDVATDLDHLNERALLVALAFNPGRFLAIDPEHLIDVAIARTFEGVVIIEVFVDVDASVISVRAKPDSLIAAAGVRYIPDQLVFASFADLDWRLVPSMVAPTSCLVENRECPRLFLLRSHDCQTCLREAHSYQDGCRADTDDPANSHVPPPVFFELIAIA